MTLNFLSDANSDLNQISQPWITCLNSHSSHDLWNSFKVSGGLGNQIAIVLAAMSKAYIQDQVIRLDFRNIAHHKNDVRNTFLALNISPFQIDETQFDSRLLNSIKVKLARTLNMTQAGFDFSIFGDMICTLIVGYFQSYLYKSMLETFFGHSLKISLNFSRKYFVDLLDEVTPSDSVVLHIRRGDYIAEKKYRGLLSSRYYLTALEQIPSENYKNLIVVSDANSLDELNGFTFPEKRCFFIGPSHSLFSTEIFYLMTQARFLVMGNSSLSWSAALFSNPQAKIMFPPKWFVSEENFNYQFRSDWKPILLKSGDSLWD